MNNIKKLLGAVALFALATQNALAITPGAATKSLQGEIVGIGQTIGVGLVVLLIIIYVAAPIGGFLFAKNISKKKAEQNQEESGGIMSFVWGMGGAIAGFFAVFFVAGYIGAMSMATDGNVDLVKGNQFIMSAVLGKIITASGTELGNIKK